ncbi:hypothetical protein AB0M43_17670 [Longispora sp. NPDC051575]
MTVRTPLLTAMWVRGIPDRLLHRAQPVPALLRRRAVAASGH